MCKQGKLKLRVFTTRSENMTINVIEVETFNELAGELNITKREMLKNNTGIETKQNTSSNEDIPLHRWIETRFDTLISEVIQEVLSEREEEYRLLTDKARNGRMLIIEVT